MEGESEDGSDIIVVVNKYFFSSIIACAEKGTWRGMARWVFLWIDDEGKYLGLEGQGVNLRGEGQVNT